MTVHTLRIDGVDVAGTAGQTILDVARETGIDIPTLCHLDGLSDVGACRLCCVEVAGAKRPLAACVTEVADGMEVRTRSARLDDHRRTVIEMLFVERNHVCSVCVANNHCELQAQAQALGLDPLRAARTRPAVEVDASHDRFVIDHNRCILCTRCVRVCAEIEGAHTWDVMGRGTDARVVTDMGTPWGESTTCTTCGKCVQVCPTGALFEKGRSVAEAKPAATVPALPTFLDEPPDSDDQADASPPSGSTAARAATCRCSTWTNGSSRSPTAPTSSTARSSTPRSSPRGRRHPRRGRRQQRGRPRRIVEVRERTTTLVSLGDCAVTANVPGMRNPIGEAPLLQRAYVENVTINPGIPDAVVPRLLRGRARCTSVVDVDVFLPGMSALGRPDLLRARRTARRAHARHRRHHPLRRLTWRRRR